MLALTHRHAFSSLRREALTITRITATITRITATITRITATITRITATITRITEASRYTGRPHVVPVAAIFTALRLLSLLPRM